MHSLFSLFLFNISQFYLHEGYNSLRYLVKERQRDRDREIERDNRGVFLAKSKDHNKDECIMIHESVA